MHEYLTLSVLPQLESDVTSKESRIVRRGAVGKVLKSNSLAAYPTSSPVWRGAHACTSEV
jgi:hypothetical protein